ncbi:thioesterase family protein [Mucilaginibacter sp. UR6-11]|uniref:acyl-CoA thioesterase n=1 Tax=Mucilaginibacter sp. UR6-11 TaxID=1435644 RepID=UPI001E53839E|nr:acyl-CoA thioesterase [Mucilaginibacter sp. UR6-11]MCC8426960.1 acyl-CoA thioesterase [Mucilaginibacter sp. UR6-11]
MTTTPVYNTFQTEYRVRPDDIDMYRHVHNSKYFDYVLAARYDQMECCYGMAMEAFLNQGLGWVVRTVYMDYKRPLILGDYFIVTTSIESIDEKLCRIKFGVKNKASNKLCCDGWFDFVLITMADGRATKIPADVIAHYASFKK